MTTHDRLLSAMLTAVTARRMFGLLSIIRGAEYQGGRECIFAMSYVQTLPRHAAGSVAFGRN